MNRPIEGVGTSICRVRGARSGRPARRTDHVDDRRLGNRRGRDLRQHAGPPTGQRAAELLRERRRDRRGGRRRRRGHRGRSGRPRRARRASTSSTWWCCRRRPPTARTPATPSPRRPPTASVGARCCSSIRRRGGPTSPRSRRHWPRASSRRSAPRARTPRSTSLGSAEPTPRRAPPPARSRLPARSPASSPAPTPPRACGARPPASTPRSAEPTASSSTLDQRRRGVAQQRRHQHAAHVPRATTAGRLGRAHPRRRRRRGERVEVRAGASHRAVPRGEHRAGPAVDAVRTERRTAVASRFASRSERSCTTCSGRAPSRGARTATPISCDAIATP